MLKLVVLLATVSVAFAAVAIYPPEDKPADFASQEGCYFSDFERVLPTTAYFYPNTECSRYLCMPNNFTQQEFCDPVIVRDGCRLSAEDNSKQYPACCAAEVCDATTTTQAPTTPTTTQAPTTPSTTQAPTTPSTTQAPTTPSTTQAPTTPSTTQATTTTTPPPWSSYAYASASSGGGQPPRTVQNQSGNAYARATAN